VSQGADALRPQQKFSFKIRERTCRVGAAVQNVASVRQLPEFVEENINMHYAKQWPETVAKENHGTTVRVHRTDQRSTT
jgi:hypothetical protein